MPAYNVEKYLDKAIKSVLDQSFRDFELIVINDGSHDRTADICRAYTTKDARFKFIDKKNQIIDVINILKANTSLKVYIKK